jgi:hypothetical protein
MYQPAMRSLVSGCGPSVVTGAASGPAVAHPGLRRGERLAVDVLAALLQQLGDVPQEGHVVVRRRSRSLTG